MNDDTQYWVRLNLWRGLTELRDAISAANEGGDLPTAAVVRALAGSAAYRMVELAHEAGLEYVPQRDYLEYVYGLVPDLPGVPPCE